MDDGDSTKNNQQIKKQANKDSAVQRHGIDAGSFLQSVWVRCRSIFPYATDRKFMESELRFVLYSGLVFWAVYLVYEILK
jgi:hypothetical protein